MESKETASVESFSSRHYNKYSTIPLRLDFVKELLSGHEGSRVFDPELTETVNYLSFDPLKNNQMGGSLPEVDDRIILGKKLKNFYEVVRALDARLIYIRSGTTGHTFKGFKTTPTGTLNFGVKIVAYPKKDHYGDMHDIRRPENAEIAMIRLLSYFVVKKQTPHIILPVLAFNASIKPFANLVKQGFIEKDDKKYGEFIARYKKGEYCSHVSVLISEWANSGDFLEFVRNHYAKFKPKHWKVFFFQILSTLAAIQQKYPSFRHNDLKANNLLVHRNEVMKKNSLCHYSVNGARYLVPNIGFRLKIWDFDFACIPGTVDNAKVEAGWTDDINVSPKRNRYYDLHYFFNTLTRGFFTKFFKSPKIPKEAKDFVNRIIPEKYRDKGKYVSSRGRILVNDEYSLPDEILKLDPYFQEFRQREYEPTLSEYGKSIKILRDGPTAKSSADLDLSFIAALLEDDKKDKSSEASEDLPFLKNILKGKRPSYRVKKTKKDT